jgi:hypothetical protein
VSNPPPCTFLLLDLLGNLPLPEPASPPSLLSASLSLSPSCPGRGTVERWGLSGGRGRPGGLGADGQRVLGHGVVVAGGRGLGRAGSWSGSRTGGAGRGWWRRCRVVRSLLGLGA